MFIPYNFNTSRRYLRYIFNFYNFIAQCLITMIAIALSIATGGRSLWYMALYAVAILISIIFFVKAYKDSSKVPQKRQEMIRQFQDDYTCPHCGRFLGNQPYHLLAQNSQCPYCRVKFIH